MVATEETSSVSGQIESPGTFGKLRQTLSSSLLTAQDKGIIVFNKLPLLYIELTIYIFCWKLCNLVRSSVLSSVSKITGM